MQKGLVFMGMGFELLGLILGGYLVGNAIDTHFGWSGYAMAGVIVICMISWMIHLVYLLKRFMAEASDDTQSG